MRTRSITEKIYNTGQKVSSSQLPRRSALREQSNPPFSHGIVETHSTSIACRVSA